MKNQTVYLFLLSFCVLSFSSCSQYVGQPVQMNHPSVCRCYSLPKTCSMADDNLSIKYEIKKTENENEYFVEGNATYLGSSVWENYGSAHFTLLLVHNGTVIESISLSAGQGDLGQKIHFSRKFSTENKFDATLIGYSMNVRG